MADVIDSILVTYQFMLITAVIVAAGVPVDQGLSNQRFVNLDDCVIIELSWRHHFEKEKIQESHS